MYHYYYSKDWETEDQKSELPKITQLSKQLSQECDSGGPFYSVTMVDSVLILFCKILEVSVFGNDKVVARRV